MKNKTPLVMGIVLVLLVIVWASTSLHPPERTTGSSPLFKTAPEFTRFEFVHPDSTIIELQKIGDEWRLTKPVEYKAFDIVMQYLLQDLGAMMVDGIVTNRPESFPEFGVTEELGTKFRAWAGDKQVLDVIVGKNATHMDHTYVREAGKNDIVFWRGLFSEYSTRQPNDWRDKIIFDYNPEDIITVSTVEGGLTHTLARKDTSWVYTENGKDVGADQSKADTIVQLLAALRGDAFAEPNEFARADGQPDVVTSFTIRNGDTNSLSIWTPGATDNGRYLVRTNKTGDVLFRFYQYRGEKLVLNRQQVQ